MQFLELLRIHLLEILASLGGATTLVTGLSVWLGRIWAKRFLARDQAEYATIQKSMNDTFKAELERQKREHELLLELIKSQLLRYSELQFKRYLILWDMLCEICDLAGALKTRELSGTLAELKNFQEGLTVARSTLRKSSILIDHAAYHEIEKFNQTAQAQVLRGLVSAADVDDDCGALELRLSRFLGHQYNRQPHEALDGQTPLDRFEADTRALRFPTTAAELADRFVVTETCKVSADNVISYASTDYEVRRGHAGTEITVGRHLLSGALSVVHDGKLVTLAPVDLARNAVSRRAVPPAPAPDDDEGALRTAAQIAFARDFAPVVGFSQTPSCHHRPRRGPFPPASPGTRGPPFEDRHWAVCGVGRRSRSRGPFVRAFWREPAPTNTQAQEARD